MKIPHLLQRAFTGFAVLCISRIYTHFLINYLEASSLLGYTGNKDFLVIIGIVVGSALGLVSYIAFLTWRAAYRNQDADGNLHIPAGSLMGAMINISLLTLVSVFSCLCLWLLPQYVPYFVKNQYLLTTIFFVQYSILTNLIINTSFFKKTLATFYKKKFSPS